MGREHVRWTRLDAVRDEFDEDGKGVRIVYTFTVSRLSREHYSRRAVRHQIRRAGHHLTLTDDPALPLAWAKN